MKPVCAVLFAAVSLVFLVPATTQAHERAPMCTEQKVLNKIIRRFNQTEKIYWKARGHRIESIVSEHRHNGVGYKESPIHRHYCHATVNFENGDRRKMHYLIEDGAGFAGIGWNVEYCIHGLDEWYYHDGRCRALEW